MGVRDTEATIPSAMYSTLLDKATQYDRLKALLLNEAASFEATHLGLPGSDAVHVVDALLNSLGNSTSWATSATPHPPRQIAAGDIRIVLMTPEEHHSYLRLSGYTDGSSTDMAAGSCGDLLRPMRSSLIALDTAVKQLEMRFDVRDMDSAVRQQNRLECLAVEAECFRGRPVFTGAGGAATSAFHGLARMTDEVSVLSDRLALVKMRAEHGVVPFCRHAMDLGDDTQAPEIQAAVKAAAGGYKPENCLADPRLAHINRRSMTLSPLDVAKGFSVLGLTSDTLQGLYHEAMQRANGSCGVQGRDIAENTLARCDDYMRSIIISDCDELLELDPGYCVTRPANATATAGTSSSLLFAGSHAHRPHGMQQLFTLLENWLVASSTEQFHTLQAMLIGQLQNDARAATAASPKTRSCAHCESRAPHRRRHGPAGYKQH